MEPKIVTKPAFTIVGFKYRGDKGPQEIPGMWGQFVQRIPEIPHNAGEFDSYGVECDEDGALFTYLGGVRVSKVEALPEGMEAVTVPAATYAVFPCTLATIGRTFDYALNTWLPASGYRRADGPDFEYYPPYFQPNQQDAELFIYIPVEK